MKIFLLCANLWFLFVRKFMTYKHYRAKVTTFILTLVFGAVSVSTLNNENLPSKNQKSLILHNKITYPEQGTGIGGGKNLEINCFPCKDGRFDAAINNKPSKRVGSKTDKLKILSKPLAKYTDAARQNQVEGKVLLRIVFLANGKIGSISPISSLPDGLTEQAIAAARYIEFKPAIRNGRAISISKTVEYNFTIY